MNEKSKNIKTIETLAHKSPAIMQGMVLGKLAVSFTAFFSCVTMLREYIFLAGYSGI